ncbi:hypothetical protein OIU84_030102 [Salix udensis]|uniref:Pentatricopeptide repeat-containing protein n=1 Tax=Salix udensis TaxID=889485 RepID=A0AAD6P832_9ROSI|nr:hypothetical protein OIU84_030102 [Salix udensis]
MLRALSTCRNHGGYERLVEEPVNISLLDGKLKRAKSVPASVFGSSKSRKLGPELALQNISPAKPSSRKVSKSHPLFSLFNNRRKKKPTARPEFASQLNLSLTDNANNRYVHTGNLFDELPHRDLYSLNSQLASYSRDGNFLATWDLFSRIHSAFFELDAYTFSPVLRACSALPDTKCGRQVHALMIKTGTDLGTITKTALMDMYSKYGCLGESVKVFEEMEFRDVVTWNALVSSFLRHGLAKEALGIFRAMRRERVEMTEFTLCSVLKACAFIKAFRQGKQVHGLVIVMGRDLVVLGTALIDFYSNAGYISEAMKVYSCLSCRKDEVLRNSLIGGCVKHGRYEEAFLEGSRVLPNSVTLLAVLSACGHSGLVKEGQELFNSAREKYGLDPNQEHYSCLIDILGRAGLIEDAWCLFHDMVKIGVGPTAAVWAALVNACCLNLDVSRGEFAAKHLLELEPNNDGIHVLVSKFYASIDRWDVVESLRCNMRKKGLAKVLGGSWLDVS